MYASMGHKPELGMAQTGTTSTLLPNWFVLLCTNNPLSQINTSERHNWRLLPKALLPVTVTTKFDFLDNVKKAVSSKAHKVASRVCVCGGGGGGGGGGRGQVKHTMHLM